jgi:starch phosphorylase
MNGESEMAGTTTSSLRSMTELLDQYGYGPIHFTGTNDALYERHLLFDNAVDPATKIPRDRYEAVARSVRDVLSQRWLRTEQTYEPQNPKRIYDLSMEFLKQRPAVPDPDRADTT